MGNKLSKIVADTRKKIEKNEAEATKKIVEFRKKCKHENTQWARIVDPMTGESSTVIRKYCRDCGIQITTIKVTEELDVILQQCYQDINAKIEDYLTHVEVNEQ